MSTPPVIDAQTRTRHARMLSNLQYGVEPDVAGWSIPALTVRQPDELDIALAERLASAFNCSMKDDGSTGDGLWDFMHETHHGAISEALSQHDMPALATILSSLFSQPVSLGLCSRNSDDEIAATEHFARLQNIDAVASLGLALGVSRQSNPASGSPPNLLAADALQTLERIEERLGWDLRAPDCGGIAGLGYRGGVVPLKQLYQIYAAHRLAEINGGPLDTCLEIGGGVGFLAHVCVRNDVVRDFTILDLPIVNLLQGYVLLRSSIADHVVLHGEDAKDDGTKVVRILPDSALAGLASKDYDMAVNQDSLPEMAMETALEYLQAFTRLVRGNVLSINHESAAPWGAGFNHGVVAELTQGISGLKRTGRFPYWMRGGYVEEVFAIRPSAHNAAVSGRIL